MGQYVRNTVSIHMTAKPVLSERSPDSINWELVERQVQRPYPSPTESLKREPRHLHFKNHYYFLKLIDFNF